MDDSPGPDGSSQIDTLINREFAEAAEFLQGMGLDPDRLSLDGPLVQQPEIFGQRRPGWRRRLEQVKKATNLKADELDDTAWLRAHLQISVPSQENLLARNWKPGGVAGPRGSVWDVIAQALQLYTMAERISAKLGLDTGGDETGGLTWAAGLGLLEESPGDSGFEPCGLEPLLLAVAWTAASAKAGVKAAGRLGLTREVGRLGRPRDVPLRAFARWLAAAGAEPMETAAIAGLLGLNDGRSRLDGLARVSWLQKTKAARRGETNPVRLLASFVLQDHVRAQNPTPKSPASDLPPLPWVPPRTPPPAMERRGDWVMVPLPSWILAAPMLVPGRGNEPPDGSAG